MSLKAMALLLFCLPASAQVIKVETVVLTNVVQQITPHPTNHVYFTNSTSVNMEVSGTIKIDAYVGDALKLSWETVCGAIYLISHSPDKKVWTDIQIHFVGNGQVREWYQNLSILYYRVVVIYMPPDTTPDPPENFRRELF